MANILLLALVLIIAIAAGRDAGIVMMAGAQSPPSPNYSSSPSCGASLATLVPCITFLLTGIKSSSPTQDCCTALASLVDTSTVCVCQLFTTGNSPLGIPINNIPLTIPINQSRALTLPGACKISTPSLSQCMTDAVDADAPVANPVSSPPLPATSSPSPAATSISKSPAASVYPSALPGESSSGILSPSASHEGPTASANAGQMMSSMLIVGLVNIIAATIMM